MELNNHFAVVPAVVVEYTAHRNQLQTQSQDWHNSFLQRWSTAIPRRKTMLTTTSSKTTKSWARFEKLCRFEFNMVHYHRQWSTSQDGYHQHKVQQYQISYDKNRKISAVGPGHVDAKPNKAWIKRPACRFNVWVWRKQISTKNFSAIYRSWKSEISLSYKERRRSRPSTLAFSYAGWLTKPHPGYKPENSSISLTFSTFKSSYIDISNQTAISIVRQKWLQLDWRSLIRLDKIL